MNATLNILSIQNGWVFSVNTSNEYFRGPFFYVTTCISYSCYILILIQLSRMRHTTIFPSKFLVALAYCLPIIATIFQFLYLEDSYITSSIATTLLLYYLTVQEATFDFDLPTKARNRIAFERILTIAEQRGQELAFILFDMNNLKGVNDTWGHHEGDHLLLSLAELLNKAFSPDGNVFGIGGDEFSVIIPRAKKGKMQVKMEQFELKLLEANAKLAHPIVADRAMYRHKAMRKESNLF